MKFNFDLSAALAPLAEITDLPFRKVVRKFSSCLMFTEMISAAGAYQNNGKTIRMMELESSSQPLGVQLFGHNPHQLAEAAKMAEGFGAALIDINMGCPVKKIVSDGNGSALMKDEALASKIIEEVAKAVSVPVSVKFRSGWTAESINAPAFAKALENAGASFVSVHGRTRAQFYSGEADWNIIKQVKEAVSIPVIGNGDIKSAKDVFAIKEQTGCDGVMIGRGALGHPWLMGEIEAAAHNEPLPKPPSLSEQKDILIEHLALMLEYYGEPKGIYQFRKHLCWYATSLRGASSFRAEVNQITDKNILLERIKKFYDECDYV